MIRYFNWTKVKYWIYYITDEMNPVFRLAGGGFFILWHNCIVVYGCIPVVHFVIQIPAVYVVSCSVL